MNTVPISQVIKTLRLKNRLSQKELAYRVGISQSHLSLIEEGKSDIKYSLLVKFADAFGVDMSYLFSFTSLEELIQSQTFLLYRKKIQKLQVKKKYPEIRYLLENMKDILPPHSYIQKYLLRQMGLCCLQIDKDAEKAIKCYTQALKIHIDKPDEDIENAKLFCEIGYTYHHLGDYAQALAHFKLATSLLVSAQQTHSDAFVYCHYLQSITLECMDKRRDALMSLRKSYRINGDRESLFLMPEICTHMSRLYYLKNDLSNCAKYLDFANAFSNLLERPNLLISIRSLMLLLELALVNIQSHNGKPLVAYSDDDLLDIYAFYYQNQPNLSLLSLRQLGIRIKQKK